MTDQPSAEALEAAEKLLMRIEITFGWGPIRTLDVLLALRQTLPEAFDAFAARRVAEENSQWAEIVEMVQQAFDPDKGHQIPPMNFDTAIVVATALYAIRHPSAAQSGGAIHAEHIEKTIRALIDTPPASVK